MRHNGMMHSSSKRERPRARALLWQLVGLLSVQSIAVLITAMLGGLADLWPPGWGDRRLRPGFSRPAASRS